MVRLGTVRNEFAHLEALITTSSSLDSLCRNLKPNPRRIPPSSNYEIQLFLNFNSPACLSLSLGLPSCHNVVDNWESNRLMNMLWGRILKYVNMSFHSSIWISQSFMMKRIKQYSKHNLFDWAVTSGWVTLSGICAWVRRKYVVAYRVTRQAQFQTTL